MGAGSPDTGTMRAPQARLSTSHGHAAPVRGVCFSPDGSRYNAACAAALAGGGQGQDAGRLSDQERAGLRKQALDCLRADLRAWQRLLEQGRRRTARPSPGSSPSGWKTPTSTASAAPTPSLICSRRSGSRGARCGLTSPPPWPGLRKKVVPRRRSRLWRRRRKAERRPPVIRAIPLTRCPPPCGWTPPSGWTVSSLTPRVSIPRCGCRRRPAPAPPCRGTGPYRPRPGSRAGCAPGPPGRPADARRSRGSSCRCP